jgi:SAM-dependent methyltransferase
MSSHTTPTIDERLRDVILEALAVSYISTSSKDEVETGNHYQSVSLGGLRTEGFRNERDEFLDMVDFRNKTVLDLGSNLGEISRAARARGAAVVDGFEYDPFFVEIACAVNAYNKTTRVSFYERDITDPSVYDAIYDVVLAFSVSHYVYPVIDVVASVTRELLVVETHRLSDNLEPHYLQPVTRFLPAYRILGFSEWSRSDDGDDERAVIAFARTKDQLDAALVTLRPSLAQS